ncbi:MAG: hypothetical protein AABW81_01535 [Nanoarchaeota archaeon]
MKKRDNELIHIRLGYDESVQAKKDILSLEVNLINTLKALKKYKNLRTEELSKKLKLSKKTKDVKNNIRNIQLNLPKMDIPEIIKRKEEIINEPIKNIKGVKNNIYDRNLEMELQEIKEKLASLHRG